MVTPSSLIAATSWAKAFVPTMLMSIVSRIVIEICLFISFFYLNSRLQIYEVSLELARKTTNFCYT